MAGTEALLAHRVRVMRLYRHSLKQMMSWAIQRSLIYEEFKNIRSQFEANANVPTLGEATRLVEAGEKFLAEKTHPDPYIVPYYYGGSSYHRNPPFPKEISMHRDFGREGH
ncbi:subunit 9 of NADH:ubiquinone oxidoreductase [Chloropicon primus]|uniref:NADH dehydrogenase [ubiquinone] 1 beta subcomplex subunit 9 n=1 Tax=Chloropicon primus TaxID=1764295 RepID=A0A5B8MHM7_9CHLO|nr:subunit 9 of NADH:ubiquinone oxidoreductase [Chloropicon primus]UPQ99148.1 subunit 9 of NADH:ubiquinone oxidoreductase [Chloropicon primus]|eukprot:QDZ19937.1 subunit 9 of NADH:ubiquinone oxidoreductase [Chloropicon primus]